MLLLQLLSLVKALRETGHFTAVSVTRPFEFEGQRKIEAADRMIAALEEAAHLVVVVEQVCHASSMLLISVNVCTSWRLSSCNHEFQHV